MSILDFALQGAATALLQRTYMIQTGTQNGVPVMLCVFDCVTQEQPVYTAEITQHPVESGESITDHIQLQNPTLKIVGTISTTPIDLSTTVGNLLALGQGLTSLNSLSESALSTGVQQGVGILGASLLGGGNVMGALKSATTGAAADNIARNALLGAYSNKTIFDVVTKRQSFKSMAIKSLSFPRDSNTGGQVIFEIDMVKVRLVSTQNVIATQVADAVKNTAAPPTSLGTQVKAGITSKASSSAGSSMAKKLFGG